MKSWTRIAAALTALPMMTAAGNFASAATTPASELPQPLALPPAIEAPRDIAFPGTIGLSVDATDVKRRIFQIRETIPVAHPGPMTLLYPKWLPGEHSPQGTIRQMAGLEIFADGKRIEWTRDPVEMFAFHIDVPAGARTIEVRMQAITPQAGHNDVVMSSDLLVLDWNSMLLYPAGYFARDISVEPQVLLPAGWKSAMALDGANREGDQLRFAPVALETLIDSPVLAGRHSRQITLSDAPVPVRLNLFADEEKDLAVSASQISAMKALVPQAYALFGSHHFDHYDALFWLSNDLGGKGLEHQRSSEDGIDESYFTDAASHIWMTDLLPHEFTHSWNGKFRRPADLWTASYEVPMRNSLLWVYEGQTQYWGQVLAVRSGMATRQDMLDQLAQTAAMLDAQSGREWRNVADTTAGTIFNYKFSPTWQDWQRSWEYYSEGQLIWLDVDTLIRERTGGSKSLDDFARAFFGDRGDSMVTHTYSFDDVVAALNAVMPYDWVTFLRSRVEGHGPGAPLDGLKRGGYRLVYTDTPTPFFRATETRDKASDLTYSVGMVVTSKGQIRSTSWHGVADNAGLIPGDTIVAVNGQEFKSEHLTDAITAARSIGTIELTIKSGERVFPVTLRYKDGLRYPKLERIAGTPDLLSSIYAPRRVDLPDRHGHHHG